MVPVCYHGPGRAGFDTAEEARDIIQSLHEANASMGHDNITYSIRTVAVSDTWDKMGEFSIDEDELRNALDLGPIDSKPEPGSGQASN